MTWSFPSRRSVVRGLNGAVATSQPLAAQAGLRMLLAGGNAFDAAIATAAALAVVEPMSTGIGGDAFALCCRPGDPTVYALNASGRSPRAANLESYRARFPRMPQKGIHSVTVPGTVDGWTALLERFGSMTLARVLEPAIGYAEDGFPVSELIAQQWEGTRSKLLEQADAAATLLVDGRAPRIGEVFRQPNLARTLRRIAAEGRNGFYRGEVAEKIVATSTAEGGLFTLEDLAQNQVTWDEPIKSHYRGVDLYECPPNGQGLAALVALNVLEGFDLGKMTYGSAEHLHLVAEALKIGFEVAGERVADPVFGEVRVEDVLSAEYAARRRGEIDPGRASTQPRLMPPPGDTVYLTAADRHGNACSFINSLYNGFGSGVVAGDTGVCLQNRGGLFSFDPRHPNRLEGAKRPFHTIIPAMALRDGRPWLSYGVMGGFMQPQGHVQVLSNMVDFGMSPQEAIDAPRLRVMNGRRVALESSVGAAALAGMSERGHDVLEEPPVSMSFGGGQLIEIDPTTGALAAGSEPRKDGAAVAY